METIEQKSTTYSNKESKNVSDVAVQNIWESIGCENISEEEVLQIASFLKEFSTLCYAAFERLAVKTT